VHIENMYRYSIVVLLRVYYIYSYRFYRSIKLTAETYYSIHFSAHTLTDYYKYSLYLIVFKSLYIYLRVMYIIGYSWSGCINAPIVHIVTYI